MNMIAQESTDQWARPQVRFPRQTIFYSSFSAPDIIRVTIIIFIYFDKWGKILSYDFQHFHQPSYASTHTVETVELKLSKHII